jgi:hypothetical protein
MCEKPTNTTISLLIMYGSSYMFRHYFAIIRKHSYCLLSDAQLRNSRQIVVDGRVVFSDEVRGDLRSTAAQLNISQKAPGTLPENGNVMPKHVGDTIHN